MENRLYRSQTDSMVAGVCGGLARYLNIDSTLVRLFFVIFTFAGGAGPLFYLLLWVIVPREGAPYAGMNEGELRNRAGVMRDEFIEFSRRPDPRLITWVGAGLIGLGIVFLIQQFNIPFLWWLDEDILWPFLLVAAGAVLLWRALKGKSQ